MSIDTTVLPGIHWDDLLEQLDVHLYVKAADGRYLLANACMRDFFTGGKGDVLGRKDVEFIDVKRSPRLMINDQTVLKTGRIVHDTETVILKTGQRGDFWTAKLPLRDEQGRIIAVCGFSFPIDYGELKAENLIGHNPVLDALLGSIEAHIYIKDEHGCFLYCNAQVEKMYGLTLPQMRGRDNVDLLGAAAGTALREHDLQVLNENQRIAFEETFHDADGRIHHFWSIKMPLERPGQIPWLLGFSTDITEFLQLRQQIETQRLTDTLTSLPNQLQLTELLESRLHDCAASNQPLAVAIFDLDQFKYINTHLGQEAGNQLLQEAAWRLYVALTGENLLARMDGDAFAVLLTDAPNAAAASSRIEILRNCLADPYLINGQVVRLTASAGLVMAPEDGADADTLLRHAEAAMYLAKGRGRNRLARYEASIAAEVAQRVDMESALRAALEARQFELYYQPKIRAQDRLLVGFEALLRWHRPGFGIVPPLDFIPLAEELGLLVDIGPWIIDTACKQLADWRAQGCKGLHVAVNLSLSQLKCPCLVERVRKSMERHGIQPDELEMEVTESMMMDEPEKAIATFNALRALGVQLAIDDFGTGYSSMAYLKRLPVQTLKLDRSFILELISAEGDAELCAGIIALAHQLSLQVVAEGVETAEQCAHLESLGCDTFQGYFFSKPLPAAALAEYLQQTASHILKNST